MSGSATLTVTAATLVSIAVTRRTRPSPRVRHAISGDWNVHRFVDAEPHHPSNVGLVQQQPSPPSATAQAPKGWPPAIAAGTVDITATLGTVVGNHAAYGFAGHAGEPPGHPINPSIPVSTSQQFAAIGIYTDNSTQDLTTQVTWSSSQTGVATISNAIGSEGLASPVAAGATTITAVSGAGRFDDAHRQSPSRWSRSPSRRATNRSPTGRRFSTRPPAPIRTRPPSNITTAVTWQSSAPATASISNAAGSEGLATAASVGGPITISATLGSISGTTQLTVTAVTLQSITIAPASATIARTTTLQFVAYGHFSDGSTQDLTAQASWSSSTQNVASVSNAAAARDLPTPTMRGRPPFLPLSAGDGHGGPHGHGGDADRDHRHAADGYHQRGRDASVHRDRHVLRRLDPEHHQSRDVAVVGAPVAKISNAPPKRGLATGVGSGDTTITARRQGLTGTAMLHVN